MMHPTIDHFYIGGITHSQIMMNGEVEIVFPTFNHSTNHHDIIPEYNPHMILDIIQH